MTRFIGPGSCFAREEQHDFHRSGITASRLRSGGAAAGKG